MNMNLDEQLKGYSKKINSYYSNEVNNAMEKLDFTFLTEEQIWGNKQLDILKKYGMRCAITDFSILLGGVVSDNHYTSEGNSRKDCTGFWWTKSSDVNNHARVVDVDGYGSWYNVYKRYGGARPALPYSSISRVSSNGVRGQNEILEVEFGEYPQTIVREDFARTLERAYSNRTINQTGKSYTTDSVSYINEDTPFQARTHIEYEYNGRKYIRFVGDSNCGGEILSDGRTIQNGEVYWVEVEPIKWLIDKKADIALSKKIIFAGVQFNINRNYEGDFQKTDIKKFMDKYFSKEIIPSKIKNVSKNEIDFTDKNIIENIINQINEISNYIGSSFKEKIDTKLKDIINEYKRMLANNDKKYENYDNLEEENSYSTAKEYLEKSLTDLLSNLKKFKEFYEVSLEINENNHLISKENILSLREKYRNGEEVELPKEMVSIKEMLTGITLYLSKMNENITREYIDKINKILQVPREKFIELTEKNLDDELLLTLYWNPKTSIILELDSIYKEIVVMYEKNKNYYELYNTLSSNKEAKEFTKGISNEIEVIRGVISELTRNNFGIELKEKFDLLFERYKVILEDNFNKNDLSNERFKEIEKSLREELQPLLLSLNKEANRYRNGSSLIEELDRVDSVVEKNEIDIIENDSTIISYVKQMLNEIDKSTLNEKQKNSLRRQIISFKNNEKKKLDGITTKEDFIRLKTEITVEFSKMFTTLCKRIINLEKYNEQKEIDNELLNMLEDKFSK